MISISPCLIVSDIEATIAFYKNVLGFEATFREPESDPFFAVIRRDGAQILIKAHEGITPTPNSSRHPFLKWDAFIYAPDPDALARELVGRGATLSSAVDDTSEGLRGFEITDPDGYVLFFGRT
jgi:catechol 2,3-dioxygenase-like lactoylglutathione lyase family enzyme